MTSVRANDGDCVEDGDFPTRRESNREKEECSSLVYELYMLRKGGGAVGVT